MYKCLICNKQLKSHGISSHLRNIHNITSEHYYLKYVLKSNSLPLCQCGCGNRTTFYGIEKGYGKFIRGHVSRINNNWGHNKSAQIKSQQKRKKMYEDGKIKAWNKNKKGLQVGWNKGLTKEIDERIMKMSKALKNKPKSKEHVEKMAKWSRKYWSDPEHRNQQRLRRSKWLSEHFYCNPSKLEIEFMNLLDDLKIDYIFQYIIEGLNYDFKLNNINILIEVDGDWWHCNPNIHNKPTSIIQENTIKHDELKNKIAQQNNFKLLRFWESDIKNNKENVIKILKENLNI
jgi:very-short-patch-repair endonuclease